MAASSQDVKAIVESATNLEVAVPSRSKVALPAGWKITHGNIDKLAELDSDEIIVIDVVVASDSNGKEASGGESSVASAVSVVSSSLSALQLEDTQEAEERKNSAEFEDEGDKEAVERPYKILIFRDEEIHFVDGTAFRNKLKPITFALIYDGQDLKDGIIRAQNVKLMDRIDLNWGCLYLKHPSIIFEPQTAPAEVRLLSKSRCLCYQISNMRFEVADVFFSRLEDRGILTEDEANYLKTICSHKLPSLQETKKCETLVKSLLPAEKYEEAIALAREIHQDVRNENEIFGRCTMVDTSFGIRETKWLDDSLTAIMLSNWFLKYHMPALAYKALEIIKVDCSPFWEDTQRRMADVAIDLASKDIASFKAGEEWIDTADMRRCRSIAIKHLFQISEFEDNQEQVKMSSNTLFNFLDIHCGNNPLNKKERLFEGFGEQWAAAVGREKANLLMKIINTLAGGFCESKQQIKALKQQIKALQSGSDLPPETSNSSSSGESQAIGQSSTGSVLSFSTAAPFASLSSSSSMTAHSASNISSSTASASHSSSAAAGTASRLNAGVSKASGSLDSDDEGDSLFRMRGRKKHGE